MKQSLWRWDSLFTSFVPYRKGIISIFLMAVCTLLCGCTQTKSLQENLSQSLNQASISPVFQPDTYEDYYSYYRGHDIGVYAVDSDGALFNDNGNRFIMNLNIEGIMSDSDEIQLPAYLTRLRTIADIKDTYTDSNDIICPYRLVVQETGRRHIMTFVSRQVIFTAVCNETSAPHLASVMLKIARSLKVNEKEVKMSYGKDTPVNYYGKKIRLFENMTPENGVISEIMQENDSQ